RGPMLHPGTGPVSGDTSPPQVPDPLDRRADHERDPDAEGDPDERPVLERQTAREADADAVARPCEAGYHREHGEAGPRIGDDAGGEGRRGAATGDEARCDEEHPAAAVQPLPGP